MLRHGSRGRMYDSAPCIQLLKLPSYEQKTYLSGLLKQID